MLNYDRKIGCYRQGNSLSVRFVTDLAVAERVGRSRQFVFDELPQFIDWLPTSSDSLLGSDLLDDIEEVVRV